MKGKRKKSGKSNGKADAKRNEKEKTLYIRRNKGETSKKKEEQKNQLNVALLFK